MPLGPGYDFPFVRREEVKQVADRSMFLNLQVCCIEAGLCVHPFSIS